MDDDRGNRVVQRRRHSLNMVADEVLVLNNGNFYRNNMDNINLGY